jgi:hypothetical protein
MRYYTVLLRKVIVAPYNEALFWASIGYTVLNEDGDLIL